jgi:hypothetical protein
MNKEECIKVVAETPDYVMSIFWIFLTVLMLAIILTIIIAGLNALAECYQERKRDYLRNKQRKLEIEALEKQKKEDSKST